MDVYFHEANKEAMQKLRQELLEYLKERITQPCKAPFVQPNDAGSSMPPAAQWLDTETGADTPTSSTADISKDA